MCATCTASRSRPTVADSSTVCFGVLAHAHNAAVVRGNSVNSSILIDHSTLEGTCRVIALRKKNQRSLQGHFGFLLRAFNGGDGREFKDGATPRAGWGTSKSI